jgi:hypothetical protein
MQIRIYFRVLRLQKRRCSLRIQAYHPNRTVTSAVCVFQFVARGAAAVITVADSAVAGLGVLGPFGPRVGNSSGVWPGSSSGRGASPGSRIGGGASGCGFPGGSSRGGSVGWPGVAGGISGGSIGI